MTFSISGHYYFTLFLLSKNVLIKGEYSLGKNILLSIGKNCFKHESEYGIDT